MVLVSFRPVLNSQVHGMPQGALVVFFEQMTNQCKFQHSCVMMTSVVKSVRTYWVFDMRRHIVVK